MLSSVSFIFVIYVQMTVPEISKNKNPQFDCRTYLNIVVYYIIFSIFFNANFWVKTHLTVVVVVIFGSVFIYYGQSNNNSSIPPIFINHSLHSYETRLCELLNSYLTWAIKAVDTVASWSITLLIFMSYVTLHLGVKYFVTI